MANGVEVQLALLQSSASSAGKVDKDQGVAAKGDAFSRVLDEQQKAPESRSGGTPVGGNDLPSRQDAAAQTAGAPIYADADADAEGRDVVGSEGVPNSSAQPPVSAGNPLPSASDAQAEGRFNVGAAPAGLAKEPLFDAGRAASGNNAGVSGGLLRGMETKPVSQATPPAAAAVSASAEADKATPVIVSRAAANAPERVQVGTEKSSGRAQRVLGSAEVPAAVAERTDGSFNPAREADSSLVSRLSSESLPTRAAADPGVTSRPATALDRGLQQSAAQAPGAVAPQASGTALQAAAGELGLDTAADLIDRSVLQQRRSDAMESMSMASTARGASAVNAVATDSALPTLTSAAALTTTPSAAGTPPGSGTTAPDPTLLTMRSAPADPEFSGEMAARMQSLVRDGVREARLQLHPAELGRLQVTVSTDGDQTRVLFVAETAAARDAIEQAMPRLREALQQSGLQLAQSDVGQRDLSGGGPGAGFAGDNAGADNGSHMPGSSVDGAGSPALAASDGDAADSPDGRIDTYI